MKKIIIFGTVFLLGVGAGLVVSSEDWTGFLTSYIPSLATLVAAYYGAKFAFEFQHEKELLSEKRNNLIATNKAIYSLSRMANFLYVYQRDFINPVRESKLAFLELRPTLDMEKELIALDIESLYFLLQTDFMNLLSEIGVEEERYRSAIDAINIRSKVHMQEVQPLLERASLKSRLLTESEIEEVLGHRVYWTIKQSTDDVIFHVDTTIKSIQAVAQKLKANVLAIYPEQKVISFVLPK